MTIIRYEPWALVDRLQRQLDRAFAATGDSAGANWIPSVDIHEEPERYVVVADLPGIEGKDIEITAEDGVLTLKGERSSTRKSAEDGYERIERAAGRFVRRFTLPETVDTSAIKASHVNGVLEVILPKRAEVKPRRIEIKAA